MGQTMGRDNGGEDDSNVSSFLSRLYRLCLSIFRRRKPPPDPAPVYHPPIYFRACNAPPFRTTSGNNNQHCVVEIKEPVVATTGIRAVENRAVRDLRPPINCRANNRYSVVEIKELISATTVIGGAVGTQRAVPLPLPSPSPSPSTTRSARPKVIKSLGPYTSEQRILLVGDGDFSFSASLATAFGDASKIVATSLDSREFLMKNYNKAATNITALTSRNSKVIHGVDATKMARHPQLQSFKFDRIVYNFPHAGFTNRNAARQLQISENQVLVKGFLKNAKKMIKEEDGQIHITHKCRGFYLQWNLAMLGRNVGLRLVEESHFDYLLYPGYGTKYGFGGDKNFDCNPSKSYKFQISKKMPN